MARRIFLILGLVLATAASLRFYGLDWGTDGRTGVFHSFHPDEKTLVDSAALLGVDMREIVASYGKAPMYALAVFEQAQGIDLKNADAWYWQGRAYETLGDMDNARFYYRQAMGLDPSAARYREAFEAAQTPRGSR